MGTATRGLSRAIAYIAPVRNDGVALQAEPMAMGTKAMSTGMPNDTRWSISARYAPSRSSFQRA